MRRWPWFLLGVLLIANAAQAQLISPGTGGGGGSGTVQSVATSGCVSGGTITVTGTVTDATCLSTSVSLTNNQPILSGTGRQVISLATGSGFLRAGSPPRYASVSLKNEVEGSLSINNLAASGTPSAATILRGDGTWASGTANAAGSAGQVQYNAGGGSFTALASLTVTNANPNFTLQIGSASLSNGRIQFTNTTNSNVFTLAQGATGATYDGNVTASSYITNSTTNGTLTLGNTTNSNTASIAGGVTTASYTWTLPTADSSGCIQSNGSGVLSITTCGGAGGGTVTASANMVSGQIPKMTSATNIASSSITDNGSGTVSVGTGAATGILSAGSVLLNGTGSGTATITPPAAAGTPTLTLPTVSGTLGFASVMARVRDTTTQTVATTVAQAVTFNTAVQNPDSLYSGGNPTRLTNNTGLTKTCQIVGTAFITVPANTPSASTTVYLYVRLNGATTIGLQGIPITLAAGANLGIQVTAIRQLATTDYVELIVDNETNQTVTIVSSTEYTPSLAMTCQ